LSVLSKYAHWMKKNSEHRHSLSQDLYERESSLKGDDEFDEVHEDDLIALAEFRVSLGLKPSDILTSSRSVSEELSTQFSNTMTPTSYYTEDQDEEETRDSVGDMKTPTPSHRSSSIGISSNISSIESNRSLISSTRGSLSPLVEEDVQDDEESSQSNNHTVGSRTIDNDEESPLSRSQLVQDYEENSQSDSQTRQSEGEIFSQSSQTRQVDEESSQSCSQTKQSEEESIQSCSQTSQGDEGSSLSPGQTSLVSTNSNKRNASDVAMDSPSTYHRSQTQTTFDGEMSSMGDTEFNNEPHERKKPRSS